MYRYQQALDVLEATSRTFYIPISRLPSGLLEAVASAYLCLRAIDEIEDHPALANLQKAELLRGISQTIQSADEKFAVKCFPTVLKPANGSLPEVSSRIGEWLGLAPKTIAPCICDATAAMADRMAYWAANNWTIRTEADLNGYTFSVAGAVGLLLSTLWNWYDGTQTNRQYAVGFGRGLQAVNILRNRTEDLARGVDFFPDGWTVDQVQTYARRNLSLAEAYVQELPPGPALNFCKIPFVLATATLDALASGQLKLSRAQVYQLVELAVGA